MIFSSISVILNKKNELWERTLAMETIPTCLTCIYGNKIPCTDNILCCKKGVLSVDTPCKKYKLDLTKKEVRKKRNIKVL